MLQGGTPESGFLAPCPRAQADARRRDLRDAVFMTILWFVVWLIANSIGTHEPLLFDPVNGWTATLILAIGLDLSAAHTRINKRNP
jgi:hypothetical protein